MSYEQVTAAVRGGPRRTTPDRVGVHPPADAVFITQTAPALLADDLITEADLTECATLLEDLRSSTSRKSPSRMGPPPRHTEPTEA
ncbi:hypothetical protein [Streptomyces sp. NPDC048516]|uniref:hypothetical protein n=1 Tax=Streptomyces sp. NPDC048516 TaxID=3365565 RepID=UPI00371CD59A